MRSRSVERRSRTWATARVARLRFALRLSLRCSSKMSESISFSRSPCWSRWPWGSSFASGNRETPDTRTTSSWIASPGCPEPRIRRSCAPGCNAARGPGARSARHSGLTRRDVRRRGWANRCYPAMQLYRQIARTAEGEIIYRLRGETQVSLLPPPCCIETTGVSGEGETRVSPPGITIQLSPAAAI